MKKTKKNKNNENQKILIISLLIALVIAIIGGATFAYWSWESAANQKTNIQVAVPDENAEGFQLNITGGGVSTTGTMYPTNDCDGTAALISDVTTVTAKNPSSTDMTVYLAIRAFLKTNGGALPSKGKDKLNWAIVDTSTTATCSSPTASGTLSSVTKINNPGTDIDTTIKFTASKEATTTKNYKLYVWLDHNYSHTNQGNVVSDPMQNLTINVQWSPDSTMVQSPTFTFIP